jgi:hypothetical protein
MHSLALTMIWGTCDFSKTALVTSDFPVAARPYITIVGGVGNDGFEVSKSG